MKAIVIGAGIGGLSTAIALRNAGIDTVVFERARELKEIGAGLSLAANATRALNGLGLNDALRGIGVPIRVAEIRAWRGEVLWRIPVWRLSEKVGAETAAVHRADLQRELLWELGEGAVRMGAECTRFEQDGQGVRAFFTGGAEERGDLLVGADGLHSKIREGLLGDGGPRYAGYTTWRAVVTSENELVPAGEALEAWGRGVRFVCAPIGRGRVYWAVSKNAPEGERDIPAGGVKKALLDLCTGWLDPVEALISATEASSILRTDIYDRDPLRKRWGDGRVTLLGDAAHPMTPDLGRERARPSRTRSYWQAASTSRERTSQPRSNSTRPGARSGRRRSSGARGEPAGSPSCKTRSCAVYATPPSGRSLPDCR